MVLDKLRKWIDANKFRQWTVGLLGCAAFIVGIIWIIFFIIGSSAPDIKSASGTQIIAYLQSDIPSQKRFDFIKKSTQVYENMTGKQRAKLRKRIGPNLMKRIKTHAQFITACHMAEKYNSLPPNQRAAFLNMVLFLIKTTGQGSEFLNWANNNPMSQAIKNPNSIGKNLTPLQQQLILGTTAEQRANLVKLGGDLLRKAKGMTPNK